MDCDAQLAFSRQLLDVLGILVSRVGHNDLDFGMRSEFISIGLCTQYYKSLCAAVTTCSTVVNIQADRQIDRQTLTDRHTHTHTDSI